jgi:selenide,water dikinase
MGARPLFALNLVAFPRKLLSEGLLEEILRGGADIARQAGMPILGGHSIDDAEPKYGLSVIGEVDPAQLVRNVGARPGDALILTKPIGTGVIATALKQDAASAAAITSAVESMTTLNRAASEVMVQLGARAATDVTGFGLIGHLLEMLRGSGAGARVFASAVPLLDGAPDLVQAGHIPGGTTRNFDDAAASVNWAAAIPKWLRILLCDAQTSGGLLIACPAQKTESFVHALVRAHTPAAAIIGEVIVGEPRIEVVI